MPGAGSPGRTRRCATNRRMTMNETMTLALAWVAGLLFGAIFFGGLWWRIRGGVSSDRPALWFLGSMLLRMGIALAGFYFVSNNDWKRLLVCLLGFIMARLVVMRLTRPSAEKLARPEQEARHAP